MNNPACSLLPKSRENGPNGFLTTKYEYDSRDKEIIAKDQWITILCLKTDFWHKGPFLSFSPTFNFHLVPFNYSLKNLAMSQIEYAGQKIVCDFADILNKCRLKFEYPLEIL